MKAKEAISINLKKLRAEKALSQVELSKKAGITQATYSLLESGTRWPDYTTLEILAKALKCEETDITSHPDLLGVAKSLANFKND